MTEEKSNQKRLQWHSAFFAGIQIELEDDSDKLIFENEHQLSTKPLEIDVLVIKKMSGDIIRKNIGKIFRGHNIIEYKSPDDGFCIDDFYKVISYAGFYKSDVQSVDLIKATDITISFVSRYYPRNMLRHLESVHNMKTVKYAEGIYYVLHGMFPMQVIVTSRLSKENNFWLKNLTNSLHKKEEAEEIFQEYEKRRNSNLHKALMDIIVKANVEVFKEARGNMCDALVELMQDIIDEKVDQKLIEKLAESKMEGRLEGLLELIKKKIVKGKTAEQIADELEETVENIQNLMEKINVMA